MNKVFNRNNSGKVKVLVILIMITLAFMWGNSLIPGGTSSKMSEWLRDLINKIFSFTKSSKEAGSGYLIRKIMHFTEFMILGIEITCLKYAKKGMNRSMVLLCGLLAAMIDETIQLFVPGRCGCITDVWLDMAGFFTGFVFLMVIHKLKA